AGRLEQALAFVQAQGLGMDSIHLGDRRDHVCAFGLPCCHRSRTYDHQFTTKQSGHGSSWIRSDQKTDPCSWANSWSRVTHFGDAKWPSKSYFCVSSARNISLSRAPIEYPIEVSLAKRGHNIHVSARWISEIWRLPKSRQIRK